MKWLTLLMSLIDQAVKAYQSIMKQNKREDLKDEIRKRDDKTTVDELRNLGI